jgi:hypothetical protein
LQALRELQAVQVHQEFDLASTAAMLAAYESSRVVDQEAIISLSAKLEVSSTASFPFQPLTYAGSISLTVHIQPSSPFAGGGT